MDTKTKDPPGFFPNPFKWVWDVLWNRLLSARWWKDVIKAQFRGMQVWKFDKEKCGVWVASSNFTWLQFTAGSWVLAHAKLLLAKTAIFGKVFIGVISEVSPI